MPPVPPAVLRLRGLAGPQDLPNLQGGAGHREPRQEQVRREGGGGSEGDEGSLGGNRLGDEVPTTGCFTTLNIQKFG